MISLVTGINGFIGKYLSQLLLNNDDKVIGISRNKNIKNKSFTSLNKSISNGSCRSCIPNYDTSSFGKPCMVKPSRVNPSLASPISFIDNTKLANKLIDHYQADIIDEKIIASLICKIKPDKIFHLSAQSNIPYSFINPADTYRTNVIGTINILEAVKKHRSDAVFISVGSSAEYGYKSSRFSFSETKMLFPSSPYGITKMIQGHLTRVYGNLYGLKTIHVRPFAIIGKGKKDDAVSDFARGIVAIERGQKKSLSVGNLNHVRDFLDVRDMVEALDLISQKGKYLQSYNICSGKGTRLSDILKIMIKFAKGKIIVRKDEKKIRAVDDKTIVGDAQKLTSLGFRPKYSLSQTLLEILEYWRGIFFI